MDTIWTSPLKPLLPTVTMYDTNAEVDLSTVRDS